jgi:hypothetical protein
MRRLRWAFNGAAVLSAVLFVSTLVMWANRCRMRNALVSRSGPIRAGDILAISIDDLEGPGARTATTVQVDGHGEMVLPFLTHGVKLAGLSTAQAQRTIHKLYFDEWYPPLESVRRVVPPPVSPNWLPLLLTSILPLALIGGWFRAHWRKRRELARLGLCPCCGYDLRATLDRCPECGTVPKAKEPI